MNKTKTNIPSFKKLPALLAIAGLLFMLLHPLQHVAETMLFGYDTVHHELPSDREDGTNESDCIECVLISSLVADFDRSAATFLNQSDSVTEFQPNSLQTNRSELGFSLRAPPSLYV